MYLSKLSNVFVQIDKCICPKWKCICSTWKMKVGQDASADEQWGLHALAAKMIALEIFTHQFYAVM